ncbi:uncharacterized protein LOC128212546 isoform X2 [Mya arenaria]|uniref:uncharacterized protein LOC128212546 isoform X2 n=1 Tax=Mya arenaria TaxID=6604 RepID=UPI0022E829DF|nr:uncharacterized protein LOC128212546 isoform X2 [Mya arenaria]
MSEIVQSQKKMSMTVKAFLELCGTGEGEIRRFPIPQGEATSFRYLADKIATLFEGLQGARFSLYWKDSEGDMVLFSTDEELTVAVLCLTDLLFKVYVRPTGTNKEDMETQTEANGPPPCQTCNTPLVCQNCHPTPPSPACPPYMTMSPAGLAPYSRHEHPAPERSKTHGALKSLPTPATLQSAYLASRESPSSTSTYSWVSGVRKQMTLQQKIVRGLCKLPGPLVAMRNLQRHVCKSTAEIVRGEMERLHQMGFGKLIISTAGKGKREFMCKPAPSTLTVDNPILAEANFTLEDYTKRFAQPNEDHAFAYLHYQYELIADLFVDKSDEHDDSTNESRQEYGAGVGTMEIKQEVADDVYRSMFMKQAEEEDKNLFYDMMLSNKQKGNS